MPSIEQNRRYGAACRRLAETHADKTVAQKLVSLAQQYEAEVAKMEGAHKAAADQLRRKE